MKGRIIEGINQIVEHGSPQKRDGHADKLLGEQTIFGPLSGQDVRMYLDGKSLERLMDVARESLIGRVELLGVGARIKIWEHSSGHRYTTWELISHAPRPERCEFVEGLKTE